MCGNIKKLRFADRNASDDELRKAALQFVRKVSGYRHPSPQNQRAYDQAVQNVKKSLAKMLRQVG